jgi:hypothetical protein
MLFINALSVMRACFYSISLVSSCLPVSLANAPCDSQRRLWLSLTILLEALTLSLALNPFLLDYDTFVCRKQHESNSLELVNGIDVKYERISWDAARGSLKTLGSLGSR